MRLKNEKIEVLKKNKISDGFGGYYEDFEVDKTIYADVFNMNINRQQAYVGEISKTALTIVTLNPIDKHSHIKFKDNTYKIIYSSPKFKKYSYDLEIIDDV